MSELHPSDERLVELALNDLDSRDQDALSAHLALCDACRLRYSGIADSVDAVLAAAPSVAPPPGFTSSVLAALGVDPAAPGVPRPNVPRLAVPGPDVPRRETPGRDDSESASAAPERPDFEPPPPIPLPAGGQGPTGRERTDRRERRVLVLAAAAAVIALLAGVVGTVAVMRSASAPAAVAAGVPFTTGEGDTVGSLQLARYEGDGVLVISVDGPAGATYDCRVTMADGSQETLATWTLPPDGSAAWVVDLPEGTPERMDLVTPTGKVWASAQL